MKNPLEYEHLKDELVTSKQAEWHFNRVKNSANKHRLELSDGDFKRFFKLEIADKDISWLMLKMSVYELSFKDALIAYITY